MLADYTNLSTNWMLSAKRFGTPWFPIFCHALIHATLMSIVIYFWMESYCLKTMLILVTGGIQLLTHFLIDILKGKMNYWFPIFQNPANKQHWYLFGIDQMLHSFVIIWMVQIISKFYMI